MRIKKGKSPKNGVIAVYAAWRTSLSRLVFE